MSHRHLDPDILGMIQELYKRVKDLERSETRRFTSLRVGNYLLDQSPAYPAAPDNLQITDLTTGSVFSVSGEVPWIDVATGVGFTNSWVNFGSGEQDMQYRKVGDQVQLRGTVKSGTVGFVPVFTLPVGYRPPTTVSLAIVSNGALANLYITSSGAVCIIAGSNVSPSIFAQFSVTT